MTCAAFVRPTSVAVIGTGAIAKQHLACLREMSGVVVTGVCDLSRAMAESAASRFGVGKWFTDHRAMLEELKPDVVHVTTPPTSHYRLAKDALAALKSAVDAATSTDQVHQIVSQALATMPFPAWPYRALDHHRPGHRGAFAGKHAKHDKSAGQNATAATLTAARGNKPCGQYGAAGASPTDISVHTVALHKDNAPAYAGRHRYHTGGSGGFDHGWGHHGGGRGGWGR